MTGSTTKAPTQTHTVKSGENLSQIASRYGMTLDELYALNKIDRNRQYIYPNEGVKIVDNRPLAVREANPLPHVNQQTQEYTVQPGDGYFKIAQKFNMNPAELMELNGKKAFWEDLIHPNDKLLVIDRNHAQKILATNGHDSAGSGKCPARTKITLVPVRYAIDESSTKNAPALHPIPSDWQPQNTHPNIKTRNYTLRQLRDGWLYVWNATTNTLYEYQIQGPNFTLQAKTDAKGKAVTIGADEKDGKLYIEFLGESKLYLSYSPVKVTDRVKKELAQHNSKWTRELDLSGFCQGTLQPNTQLINNISHYVADISGEGKTVGNFSTTTLPTQKVSGHDTYKSPITQDTLKAAVPNVDDALFIALEDPLAIVDDLTMQLIGRWAEKFAFNEQNEHKLVIAKNCLDLLGTEELTADIPADIKKDPAKYYQCIADINKYYDDIASIDNKEANAGDSQAGEVIADWLFDTRDKIKKPFQEKWHFLPSDKNKNAWKSSNKTRLIDDLRMQEMLKFLADATVKLQALDQHIKNSETDLRVWLDLFNEQILHIYHDNLHAEQTTTLLETVDTVISFLGMSEEGKQWIGQRCANPQTLFALGTANFDQPLYNCIKTVAQELDQKAKTNEKTQTPSYVTDQWLIDNIAGNNNLGIMRYLNASNSTNVVSRIGEIQSAIDMVKESASFKKLPESSKQALETQRILTAKDTAHATMQHLEHNTLSAIATDTDQVLTQSILSSARQDQVNGTTINIGHNPDHAWQKKEITRLRKNLNQKIYYRRFRIRQADAGLLTLKPGVKERYLVEIELFIEQRSKLNIHKAPVLFAEVQNNHINDVDIKQHSELADLLSDPSKTPQAGLGGTPPKTPATNNKWFAQRQQKLSAWINNKGGFLPIIVFGFNLYNLKAVNEQAAKNNYDNNSKRELISAAGYAANAFTALYVMPYWSKYASQSAILIEGQAAQKITSAGIAVWAKGGNAAFSSIATRMAAGMAMVSAFALIGASVELYQVYNNDYSNATSGEEKILLGFKMGALGLMTLTASAQLLGAALAPWYAFGWIMSTPIGIAIAVIGVLYLIFSFWSAYYKREGLRLWFYRCTWGKAPNWQNTPTDHKRELHALYKLLLQPTLKVQRTNSYNDRAGFYPVSSWVAIQLPKTLAGNTITLESQIVNGATTPHSQIINGATLDYYQWIANGHWIAAPDQGSELTLPSVNGPDKAGPSSDVNYSSTENSRVWLTKLVYNSEIQQAAQQNDELMIELKITYPDTVFGEPQPDQDNSYLFTIPLSSISNAQGKLETDYYSTSPLTDTLLDKQDTPFYRIYRDASSFQQLEIANAESIDENAEETTQ